MSKKLDHDVLKQTTGLLSQIDRVLSETTVAERVERVLSSAAPLVNGLVFPSIEDWTEWHKSQESNDGGRFESSQSWCGPTCSHSRDMIPRETPMDFIYGPWREEYYPVDGWCRSDCAVATVRRLRPSPVK